jgi:hypothetical protein
VSDGCRRLGVQEAVDAAVELRVDEHRLAHALGHASVLPALGMQRRPLRPAPAVVVWESTSHVAFGTALEALRRAWSMTEGTAPIVR